MSDDEHRISAMIFTLLHARASNATICPSEAARALEPLHWRPLMPMVNAVAQALARDGRLELRQRGVRVAAGSVVRGPVRWALSIHEDNEDTVGTKSLDQERK